MTSKITTRKQAEERLIERARSDSAFRRRLVADPKAVIRAELGISLADSVKLRVLEETPDTLYVVLPARQAGELTEEQLDVAVGGTLKEEARALQEAAERRQESATNSSKWSR